MPKLTALIIAGKVPSILTPRWHRQHLAWFVEGDGEDGDDSSDDRREASELLL